MLSQGSFQAAGSWGWELGGALPWHLILCSSSSGLEMPAEKPPDTERSCQPLMERGMALGSTAAVTTGSKGRTGVLEKTAVGGEGSRKSPGPQPPASESEKDSGFSGRDVSWGQQAISGPSLLHPHLFAPLFAWSPGFHSWDWALELSSWFPGVEAAGSLELGPACPPSPPAPRSRGHCMHGKDWGGRVQVDYGGVGLSWVWEEPGPMHRSFGPPALPSAPHSLGMRALGLLGPQVREPRTPLPAGPPQLLPGMQLGGPLFPWHTDPSSPGPLCSVMGRS